METIRTEHDNHNRTVQEQKSALDNIITELGSLQFIGKDREAISHAVSPVPTAEGSMDVIEENTDVGLSQSLVNSASVSIVDGGATDVEDAGDAEENTRMEKTSVGGVRGSSLNPGAKPCYPRSIADEDDDIEMGEVAEEPKDAKGKRKAREELEEGEASDTSSDLSEPPDD
jgi:THO complex subunit 7